VTQTIGASGGTVTAGMTSGGTVKLEVLAGTVSSANVTLQPVTDTLNGAGQGVAITSDVAWSKYARITFPVDASDESPEGLGIAVQQADGSWLSLDPVKVDVNAKTLTAGLPATFRTAGLRAQAGLQLTSVVKFKRFYLKPASATVKVKGTKAFVPYAQVIQNEKEGPCGAPDPTDDLAPICQFRQVTREYPFTNDKAGFTRLWFVNGVLGGNGTVGTISKNGAVGATYTAPANKPSPDTVTVTFQSINDDTLDNVAAKASVKIISDTIQQYQGTVDFQGVVFNGLTQSGRATLTWNRIDPQPFEGGNFQASGTVTVTVTDTQSNCNSRTLTLNVVTSESNLEVLPSAAGKTHKFTLLSAEGQTVLLCPGEKEFFFSLPLYLTNRDFPYTDITVLEGSNQPNGDAGGAGGTVSWRFTAMQ
jgi:hypothetical protein